MPSPVTYSVIPSGRPAPPSPRYLLLLVPIIAALFIVFRPSFDPKIAAPEVISLPVSHAVDEGAPLPSVKDTDCVFGNSAKCLQCPLQGTQVEQAGYFYNYTSGRCTAYLNKASSSAPFKTLDSCLNANCPLVYESFLGSAPPLRDVGDLTEMEPIACKQTNCFGFDGPGDVFVGVGTAMYPDSYGNNKCNFAPAGAKVFVNIPTDVSVYKAYMYWSSTGEGEVKKVAKLNNIVVESEHSFQDENWRLKDMKWYGAYADVSHIVTERGNYVMKDYESDPNIGAYCEKMNDELNYAYAGMALVVVYTKPEMPVARTNICFNSFRLTYPNNTYSHTTRCVAGHMQTKFAKTYVAGFMGDGPLRERWYINNKWSGVNLFRGLPGRMVDNLYWEITNIVRTGTKLINHAVRSREKGVLFPVRVVYHTL